MVRWTRDPESCRKEVSHDLPASFRHSRSRYVLRSTMLHSALDAVYPLRGWSPPIPSRRQCVAVLSVLDRTAPFLNAMPPAVPADSSWRLIGASDRLLEAGAYLVSGSESCSDARVSQARERTN